MGLETYIMADILFIYIYLKMRNGGLGMLMLAMYKVSFWESDN